MAHKTFIRHTQGKRAVLFIHGFLGSPEHFEKFIDVVPSDCAVYNILLDGHGGTVKDFAKASMNKWKANVRKTVDNLLERYEELIICGHSMGTFFAMEEAIRNPKRISKIFLLAIPLKIGVRGEAFLNTAKSFFNFGGKTDKKAEMYKKAHSVKLNKRLWQYIGWIPRYIELIRESGKSNKTIKNLETEAYIYMSAKDELVSCKRSLKHIPKKDNIHLTVLPASAHFIYDDEEYNTLLQEFGKLFIH